MGAIFCTVIRTIACGQEIPCITVGNQKCRGAAPTFSIKALNTRKTGLIKITVKGTVINKTAEPSA